MGAAGAPRRLRIKASCYVIAVGLAVFVESLPGAFAEANLSLVQNASDPNPEPLPNLGATSAQTQTSSLRQLTETWDRLRTQLSDRGVQFGIRYDGEGFADLAGGRRRGGTYLGNLNLQLTLDAQRLTGWPGATVFLYGLGIHGGHPSNFVGDAQGVSNIEAPAKWKLEEGWVQQNLFGNRFSALFGRYDLNSEFYRLQSASLFLNSSFGIGPEFSQSGQNGPSIFPFTSVGGRFAIKPIQEVVFRTAVLDGVPVERPNGARQAFAKGDGALIVTEVAYLYRPVGSEQPRIMERHSSKRNTIRGSRIEDLRSPLSSRIWRNSVRIWPFSRTFNSCSIQTQTRGSKMLSLSSFGLKLRCDAYDLLVGKGFWVTSIIW